MRQGQTRGTDKDQRPLRGKSRTLVVRPLALVGRDDAVDLSLGEGVDAGGAVPHVRLDGFVVGHGDFGDGLIDLGQRDGRLME